MKRLIKKAFEWDASESRKKEIEAWLRNNQWAEQSPSIWVNALYPKIKDVNTTNINIIITFSQNPGIIENLNQDIDQLSDTVYQVNKLEGLQNLLLDVQEKQ